jgi:[ribosomal protein S5]-alanine N-acetyltransferase
MARKWGWAATLCEPTLLDKRVVLRPARLTDAYAWREIRTRNAAWLHPWQATLPDKLLYQSSLGSYLRMLAGMYREHLRKRGLSWVIVFGDELVGQLTIGSIVWGSNRSALIGYWIDQRSAGRSIVPTALAMAVDHSFHVVGLHRVEAGVQPENHASRRVMEKLGFHEEGLRRSSVHINGAWRDHLCYALTAEDAQDGLMTRWRTAFLASKSAAGQDISPSP